MTVSTPRTSRPARRHVRREQERRLALRAPPPAAVSSHARACSLNRDAPLGAGGACWKRRAPRCAHMQGGQAKSRSSSTNSRNTTRTAPARQSNGARAEEGPPGAHPAEALEGLQPRGLAHVAVQLARGRQPRQPEQDLRAVRAVLGREEHDRAAGPAAGERGERASVVCATRSRR